MSLTTKQIKDFQKIVLSYYKKHGRHHLPWRTTHTTPYHILVSEIMLQQTQVERVIPKFLAFVERFPTIKDLAKAPQSDAIRLWSGLGYNRRARFLWLAAQTIVKEYQGNIPQTLPELLSVPGIGPYTASAILAFAYNRPVSVIETNIRTVYIHHFFPNAEDPVSDTQLLPLIASTVNPKNPRQWYAALMDYGSHLKITLGNLTQKSLTYTKQSKFKGSNRQLRGAIIKVLTQKSPQSLVSLTRYLEQNYHGSKIEAINVLKQLEKDKLIGLIKKVVFLKS
jgi:A/G-specific adenine glycosylase